MLMHDFGEDVARRKCAPVPENWGIVEWERCGSDAVIYRGAEYSFYTKGPRKGKKKWGKRRYEWECVVTSVERDNAAADWEKETGKCSRCGGDGQEWSGWSVDSGHRFKICKSCFGTGNANNV